MKDFQYFQRKPIVVEAIEFDGTSETANRIIDWINYYHGSRTDPPAVYHPGRNAICIKTPAGVMDAHNGDWVIHAWREFYPVDPEVLKETYLPIPPE